MPRRPLFDDLGARRLGVGALLVLAWSLGCSLMWLQVATLRERFPVWAPDAHAYWNAWNQDLYDFDVASNLDRFLYSPAFAVAVRPLTLLPYDGFAVVWTTLLVGLALWLLHPVVWWWRLPLVGLLCAEEIVLGNIHLLLAAVIVLGVRTPALWAFALLTKPMVGGLGLLWFLVARQWRQLSIALSVTAAVTVVGVALAPDLWSQWLSLLLAGDIRPTWGFEVYAVRLAVAGLLVVVGARAGRPWLLAVAVCVALPLWRLSALAVLTAVPRLLATGDAGGRLPATTDVSSPEWGAPTAAAPSVTAGAPRGEASPPGS